MNVAAGTWRQGGRIGGTKEAGTTFDPHLAVEQRHAIARQRVDDVGAINAGMLAPEHEAALIFDMLRDQRVSGVLGGNPGILPGERLIDVLPNGAAVYEADDLFRGRTGESTQDILDRIDRGDIQDTDVALAALGVGVAVETVLTSPMLAVGAVSGLIPLARDYLVSRVKGITIAEAEQLSLQDVTPRLVKIVNGITAIAVAASGLGVGGGVVKKLAEGDHSKLDNSHQSPDGNPPIKALGFLAAASAFLASCREWLSGQTAQPPTVEVTKVTVTPKASETPTPTLTPTFTATATETPTLVPTETPILPLPAFISGETIGDGTMLVPIMRAPLPFELSTFIPVDGKLPVSNGELTGLSGVKLCLGFESDTTCYGVRAPAPEFLSRHLEGRVVTYRLDRDASQDGVQVYVTDETGEGIAPQQVFINRVPMRPGLHFETVIRDGSGQHDPAAGQLLMTWIDTNKQKVVEALAQVRDFNSQTDRIDIDYTNGVITLTYADGRVEPFDIGRPRYPTVTPWPRPTWTPVPPTVAPTETSVSPPPPSPPPAAGCDLQPGNDPTAAQIVNCAIRFPATSHGWGYKDSFNPDTGETVIGSVGTFTFVDGNTRVVFQEFKQCGSLEDYNNWEVAASSLSVRQFLGVLPYGALLVVNNDQSAIGAKLRTVLTSDCGW